jgi:glycosyl transferase family 87
MKSSRLRWIFIVVGSLSLIISYLGIWIRFINNPVERTGSDFIAFYTAGRVAQSYGAAYVYNISLQQDIQEEQVGFSLVPGQVLLYNHLPFLIPILHILVSADYVGSFYRWIFLLIALFITSISVLSGVLKDARFDSRTRLITGVGSLLFLPLFFSLMNGQDSALLLLGTALWMYGLFSGKEITAGLGLSLTTIRPHLALILALPMLFSYRKVFLGFILGSGVLALLSFLILGMQGTREFIDILFISANGEWYGMKESAMYNLIGLLVRTIPWLEVSTIRAVGWSIYGVTGIGLCIVWARNRNIQDGQIGLTVTLGLFVAPHLHFHDLTLLLIPIYELIRSSTRSAGLKTSIAIALPIAISLLLLLSNSYPLLQYSIPYLILLSLAGYPYYQKYKMPIPAPHQSSSPER